ncbi:MAG: AAA family ATPase [Bacteroidetes bacterium]|nr:MAG: AAA family ATPase [Bacteroidota bacterium]
MQPSSFEDIKAELQQLQVNLALEKSADLEYHRQKVQSLPLERQVEEGYAWYKVQVIKTGYTYGQRAFVIIERPEPHLPDQFRAGNTVALFTREAGVKRPEVSGIIHFVNRHKMNIILNQEDLPSWLQFGPLGVVQLFDDRTYREMEKALEKLLNANGDRLAELRDTILGRYQATFREVSEWIVGEGLNEAQNAALREVVGAHQLAVIHGPPGTGKTTTLVQVVLQLTQTEPTVLVTAPSNTAVDLLTERLAATGLRVLRIGNISRVDESVMRHSLDQQLANHPEAKTIKKLKIEAAELRRQAKKYKRKFGAEQRRSRGRMFKEAGQMNAWAYQLEQRLIDELVESAQVVTATLVGANHSVLEHKTFRTVVIDEAAQALEPASWIPILKASRVVLTGDPYQLPPTVKSREAAKQGLSVTLLEKALARQQRTSLLNIQYRMHEQIMAFSNQRFYQGALVADASVAQHTIPHDPETPLVFIDTAGADCSEQIHPLYKSRYNDGEYHILREHLYELLDVLAVHQVAPLPNMAIISPYREQVTRIEEMIAEDNRLAELDLTVKTIDGFQGQERDIIYLSLVRSNLKSEIGFLKDYRRMNVAMTRARKKLVIIGDSATIGSDPFYNEFVQYAEKLGTYRTAWEFLAK